MHERNIYKNSADIEKFANEYPDFKSLCKTYKNSKLYFDLKFPENAAILTQFLLKSDFDLKISLHDQRLLKY